MRIYIHHRKTQQFLAAVAQNLAGGIVNKLNAAIRSQPIQTIGDSIHRELGQMQSFFREFTLGDIVVNRDDFATRQPIDVVFPPALNTLIGIICRRKRFGLPGFSHTPQNLQQTELVYARKHLREFFTYQFLTRDFFYLLGGFIEAYDDEIATVVAHSIYRDTATHVFE